MAIAQTTEANASSFSNTEWDEQQEILVEQALTEFKNAKENDLPAATNDLFHVTQQFLEVYDGGAWNGKTPLLEADKSVMTSRYNMTFMALPEVPYGDLDKNVDIELDPANHSLSLVLYSGTRRVARHIFTGFEPVTFARDKEFLSFLDASGKIFTIDLGYARTKAFKGPVPVFEAGDTGRRFKAGDAAVSAHFLTRGLKPFEPYKLQDGAVFPVDKPLNARFTAGDLVVIADPNGSRELVGMFDRNVMRARVYQATAMLMALVQPFVRPQIMRKHMGDTPVTYAQQVNTLMRKTRAAGNTDALALDPLTRKALAAVGFDSFESLMKQAAFHLGLEGRTRDQFNLRDLTEDARRYHQEAVLEQQEENAKRLKKAKIITMGIYDPQTEIDIEKQYPQLEERARARLVAQSLDRGVRAMFYRVLTSKGMKIFATVTGVGAAGALSLWGAHMALVSKSHFWAVSLVQKLYDKVWPDVWKDAAYRVTMFKAAFYVSFIVPIFWTVGLLNSKFQGQGWSAQKGLVMLTWRMVAVAQYSWLKRVAKLARQENFVRALQLNVRVFRKVRADSDVGRAAGLTKDVYPALNNPFATKEDRQREIDTHAKVLDAIAGQNACIYNLAQFLSLVAVARKADVDPVLLTMMIKDRTLSAADFVKLTQDPGFSKKWSLAAQEMALVLRDLGQNGSTADLKSLDSEKFAALLKLTNDKVSEINSRGDLKKIAANLRLKWNTFASAVRPFLGNYGAMEYNFLANAEAEDWLAKTSTVGFFLDFDLTQYQTLSFGARANVHTPEDLAASASHVFGMSPRYRADVTQQMTSVTSSANMGLVYQRLRTPIEDLYDPIQHVRLLGKIETEGFFSGVADVFKSLAKLDEAQVGYIWTRNMMKKGNTLQFVLPMAIGTRFFIAGKTFVDASLGALYILSGAGNWMGGFVWDPVRRGMQMHEEKMERRSAWLAEAKAILDQGLHFDDVARVRDGYERLKKLYVDSKYDLPPEMVQATEAAEQFLQMTAEEITAVSGEYAKTAAATEDLEKALATHDDVSVKDGERRLRELYRGTDFEKDADFFKMNARSLLQFSLEHPPFATRVNEGVRYTVTIMGSITSTYLLGFVNAMVLHNNIDWGSKFAHMLPLSFGLYMGTYWAQRGIDRFAPIVKDYVKEKKDDFQNRNCLILLDL